VYEKDVLIGRGARSEEVGFVGNSSFDEPPVNAPVLFGRKDVSADGKIVFLAINKLE
jgi:hypothetical protein